LREKMKKKVKEKKKRVQRGGGCVEVTSRGGLKSRGKIWGFCVKSPGNWYGGFV
jgi:hypothetical protein